MRRASPNPLPEETWQPSLDCHPFRAYQAKRSRQRGRHSNVSSPHLSSVNNLKRQMTLKEPAVEISANLEYPACPLCASDRREFPFRLHEPYRVARCMECGLHYLYPPARSAAALQVGA